MGNSYTNLINFDPILNLNEVKVNPLKIIEY